MSLSQFLNLIGMFLGIAGSLLVARNTIDMDLITIVKTQTDLCGMWKSINDAYSFINIRSYILFGTAILALSYLFQIISVMMPEYFSTKIVISLGDPILPTILAGAIAIAITRFLEKGRKKGVKKRIEQARIIYKELKKYE